jgi:L-rhamnose-H+ transport protein
METASLAFGLLLSLVSGFFLGTFAWPMKKMATWHWENIWIMYSIWGLILLPWIWAFLTVPNLLSIYDTVPFSVLVTVFLFGAGWGLSSIGFGIGLNTLGIALGSAIVLGLINAIGTILPILIYKPEVLSTQTGVVISLGVAIMLVGIVFCALAGVQKEKALQVVTKSEVNKRNFTKGLIICIFAGLLGAMFNFALLAGKPMEALAIENGASTLNAANPTWCVSLFGGFIITLIYCFYLFRKNTTWSIFKKSGTNKYWIFTFIMGIMWFGGIALYGTAVMKLGNLGASIGWPIIQSMAILSGNLIGLFSGEWKGSGRKPLQTMFVGLLLLVIGISVISYAGSI